MVEWMNESMDGCTCCEVPEMMSNCGRNRLLRWNSADSTKGLLIIPMLLVDCNGCIVQETEATTDVVRQRVHGELSLSIKISEQKK